MSEIISNPIPYDRVQEAQLDSLRKGYNQLTSVMGIMGFASLRPGQEPVIVNILTQRDTLCILPTSCHAPGQGILMADGNIKNIEDITIDDYVLGWDGTKRKVMYAVSGRTNMRKIICDNSSIKPFVVSSGHLLTLYNKINNSIIDLSVNHYCELPEEKKFYYGLFKGNTADHLNIKESYSFNVEDVGEGEYFGINIEGDGRYLMEDFTVTHNTGKTACFVVPTLCLNWRTVVFSPLVALMRDQVQGLQAKGIKAGAVSSVQSDAENQAIIRKWAEGELQFIYVAPERLHSDLFKEAIRRVPPDMVVCDECHIASQASDNFRSSYCLIGDFIKEFNPKVVAAFTATCTDEVERDVRRIFHMQGAKKLTYYARRSNLILRSQNLHSDSQISDTANDIDGPLIVYCATIKKVEQMAKQLNSWLREDVIIYHGELSPTDKRVNQDLFMHDKVRVMVATNAFGTGVDKGNIRGVIHRDIPGSIEQTTQEVGRSGRDGKESMCMTFYSPDSYDTQKFFIETSHPNRAEISNVLRVLDLASDSNGVSQLTIADIVKKTNMFSRKVPAILETLKSSKVIYREKSGEKIAKIRLDENIPEDDARFEQWWEIIKEYGIEEDGFYNIDLNWLSDHVGLGYPTVTNHLKRWDTESAIRYIPPFRGSATKIIGSLDQIDFGRLAEKAAQAHSKLEKVIDYIKTPDNEKHDFLEAYFKVYS